MNQLVLAEKNRIEQEVIESITNSDISPALDAQAQELVTKLVSIDMTDIDLRQRQARMVSNLGESIAVKLAQQSVMLKQPIGKLVAEAQDGGPVAKGLLSLQEQVNEINPNRVDFSMGTARRMLAMLPGIGTPLSRWFSRYQTVQGVINDIIQSLRNGEAQLERDNVTLRADQKRMRELTFALQDYIKLGELLDAKLSEQTEQTSEEDKRRFLEEEVLFPLRQRIMDLQQMLAVNQQGVLSTEVIIRNNQELIRGVGRAVHVTVTALSTASTLALALQAQGKVLKSVQSINQTTNDLIAHTAATLKTQGVEIQKQASSAQLDLDTLKKAFNDVQTALEDISQFRRDALPRMAHSIIEMSELTERMEGSIRRVEGAEQASVALQDVIEIVDANA